MTCRPRVLLVLAIAVQIALFAIAQRDVPTGDPLAYAENAFWIGEDPAAYFQSPSNHPFVMRVGITLPLAAIFQTLGVSQWTTNLPCILAVIVMLIVVYAAAPTERSKCIGLGFATTSSAIVLYGTELNADLLCGAASALSLLLLSRRDRVGSAWWVVAAVVFWFHAYLIKETAIWFAPAWLYALVVDLRALGWRAAARRFAPALALGLALVVAYLVVCAHVWGDPLARIAGINTIAGDHGWTSRGKSASWWLYRLTVGPVWMYVTTFGATLLVGVAGARRIHGAGRLWVVATAAYLLLYWVGSGSTTEYVPLPLTHRRMLMTALPCVLVIAALATDVLPWRRWVTTVVTALVVLPFIVTVAFAVARERPETAMSRVIRDDVAAPGNVVVVCPDFRYRTAIPFAFGFRLPPNLQLVNVVDFASAPDPAPATRVRVVVKPYARERLYGGTSIVQPIEALGLRPMYSHRRMRLYDAGDGTQLHAVLRPLLGR